MARDTGARATALSFSQEEAQHASLLRARCAALALCHVYVCLQGHCIGERPLCFGARPWCDMPATASKNQLAFAWHACARHCARCLLGEGAARELAAHAQRAATIVVEIRTRQGHYSDERPLSFGTRPWCDMPAAASNNQPSFACHARVRHCARCLSEGSAARKFAARARCATLPVPNPCVLKGPATARGLSPSARGRGVTCQL